ncbi:MAG: hypothetical protein GVY13_12975 [Alphaproteobacteria bacterium]|jgi:hypothetical protein|nr:hypothetical protein [Alphaproteobacteria bacterium]
MTIDSQTEYGRGNGAPPSRVRIAHHMVGDVHVFTSPDLDDFQVADHDLETAFAAIPHEVCAVVADECGQHPPYVLTLTYREYSRALYGVHREPGASAALHAVMEKHAHIVDPKADYVPPARLRRQALLQGMRGSD